MGGCWLGLAVEVGEKKDLRYVLGADSGIRLKFGVRGKSRKL